MEHRPDPDQSTPPRPASESLDSATAFDHAHPEYNPNAPEIWADLRGRCPVAHTQAYGGVWLPVNHADVHQIAYDTQHFSSVGVVVSNVTPDLSARPVGGAPPITSDPPFHAFARRVLLPAFSPRAIDPLEDDVRVLCRRLLDEMGPVTPGMSVVDAAVQYAQHIPVRVIAHMLGLPESDEALFRDFVHDVLEAVDLPVEERQARFEPLTSYLAAHVDAHVDSPRDDLVTYLLQVEVEGVRLTREQVVGMVLLVLVAGIDTTWSAIGSSLWHLARTPADVAALRARPELWPTAIEELLRAYAPVTMARVVVEEVEVGGVTMRPGDWTLLPFPAANRDPEQFDDPDTVDLAREHNRHAAFGLGIHRCIGSNLARLELRVALEEFTARFESFELADPDAVTWSVGQVRGPRRLPVRIV